jgi:hypothetical protein
MLQEVDRLDRILSLCIAKSRFCPLWNLGFHKADLADPGVYCILEEESFARQVVQKSVVHVGIADR